MGTFPSGRGWRGSGRDRERRDAIVSWSRLRRGREQNNRSGRGSRFSSQCERLAPAGSEHFHMELLFNGLLQRFGAFRFTVDEEDFFECAGKGFHPGEELALVGVG